MPLEEIHYPQPSTSGLAFIHSPWRVREGGDDYEANLPALLDLADLINDKLTKAQALSWLLHSAGDSPEDVRSVTAQVIAELIGDGLEAHERQWERLRRHFGQK